MASSTFAPGANFLAIARYCLTAASLAYAGLGGFFRYESLIAPFVYSLSWRSSAAFITASLAATELITIVSGFQASAFACSIAFTVGVGVVSSTHVSAPDSFCFR